MVPSPGRLRDMPRQARGMRGNENIIDGPFGALTICDYCHAEGNYPTIEYGDKKRHLGPIVNAGLVMPTPRAMNEDA